MEGKDLKINLIFLNGMLYFFIHSMTVYVKTNQLLTKSIPFVKNRIIAENRDHFFLFSVLFIKLPKNINDKERRDERSTIFWSFTSETVRQNREALSRSTVLRSRRYRFDRISTDLVEATFSGTGFCWMES